MILGQPKTLNEIPPFTATTIEQLAAGMEQQVASGHPLDVPTMMPMGQLAQIARTMKAYLDIAKKAATTGAGLADMNDIIDAASALREEAQALLDTPEPLPPPRIQPAKGSLIIPK